MNEIAKKLLLAGNKFIPEMHLKHPGFTSRICESFTKNKERINKFKERRDARYIYHNELEKAWSAQYTTIFPTFQRPVLRGPMIFL